MSDTPTPEEARNKIAEIVRDIGTAMMVTRHPEGGMHARPMATAEFDDDWQTLWFASRRDSGKVEELRSEPEVCLAYAGGQSNGWVSLTGVARVVDDRAKVNELYRSQWDNWFDGADDPNLVLIEVLPHTGEYWDAGSRLMVMAKLAAAAVTGMRFDVGENQTVSM